MDLNLSGLQIAQELDIHKVEARSVIQEMRQGIVDHRPRPPSPGRSNVTKSMLCQDIRAAARPSKKGQAGRRRCLTGEQNRETTGTERPPIFGVLPSDGVVLLRMLENVNRLTIDALIK